MSSVHDEGADCWGVLINPDKSPTPLLEQLCLGIAQVMTSFDEFATTDLTPDRLAAFYRKVGGNYDVLFLDTRPSALSFIYQRLGCFHSIQPTNDPYKPPSVPALQPNGFVRWQTIQLLLDPDEHSRWLKNAVGLWDIETPNGGIFPKSIPRDAFPAEPDPEMVQWHEEVSRRFELDYWKKNIMRSSPPNFGPYYSYFNQKDAPPPNKENEMPRSQRRTTTHRQEPAPSNERRPSTRHRRRRSGDIPPSTTRRVQSTYFPRQSENIDTGYTSRAPSPPAWAAEPPRTRTRERQPTFARPISPGTVTGNGASDASSEDSGPAPEPSPRTSRHSHHRNLSPPRVSHARRHSHDAYARRPRKDLSPDAHKHLYHEPHKPNNPGRLYDSDGARRVRASRVYDDGPLHHRSSGAGFRERVVSDPPAFPPAHEVPIFTRMRPHYAGAGDTYMVHPHADLEPMNDRRGSYRNEACTPERARYIDPRNPRWAAPVQSPPKRGTPAQMVDAEYPRGRRTTMYDR